MTFIRLLRADIRRKVLRCEDIDILIEVSQNLTQYRLCPRCETYFPLEGRIDQEYCSYRCARNAAQAAYRKRKK